MNPDTLVKIREILGHISKLFDHYQEDDNYFEEYSENVLKLDTDKSLICFRDLIKQLPRTNQNEQRLQRVPIKLSNVESKPRNDAIDKRRKKKIYR